ncbi:MAG: RNA methyltransferase [Holophagales bacterium]|nr:RNA methyltransferase [Holophagales bacterium]
MPSRKMSSQQIFGFHPVRELLRHRPHIAERVWCSARAGKRRSEIEALCRRHRVAFENVPGLRLDQTSGGHTHNGFAAFLAAGGSIGARAVDRDLLLLAEDVQDPRNLGALLRVCEGAGVGRVLIRDRGSAPLSPVAVKASAGATEWLEVERMTNSAQEIEKLKSDGFWVFGADASGQPPWELDLSGKVVLCVGGEAKGLRERTRKSCDFLVGLPMRGRVRSLNLATAASALLYEAVRQRASSGGRVPRVE